MRISDWSSDVCSSDLLGARGLQIDMVDAISEIGDQFQLRPGLADHVGVDLVRQRRHQHIGPRSEEHTSELQSLMRISYAVFCLKKKTLQQIYKTNQILDLTTLLCIKT